MKKVRDVILVLLGLVLPVAGFAETDGLKVVFVQDNEIFIAEYPGGEARKITDDGARKYLPAWSKDGSMVAFIRAGESGQSLGNLIIISEVGKVLHSLSFRSTDDLLGGMRFIESLEWLDRGAIAVSGSVNPSLTETAIVDVVSQDEQGGIFDDGAGADFSPDGRHFAYFSGSPHFTPEELRNPVLNVDHETVFPAQGRRVRFVSPRHWSPDGEQVAVVAEDLITKRRSLVVWSKGRGLTELPVGLSSGADQHLFWADGDFAILPAQGEEEPGKSYRSPLQKAREERSRLVELVTRSEGRDADVWCGSCILTILPRKVSVRDSD